MQKQISPLLDFRPTSERNGVLGFKCITPLLRHSALVTGSCSRAGLKDERIVAIELLDAGLGRDARWGAGRRKRGITTLMW